MQAVIDFVPQVLRPYQEQAIKDINASWERGNQSSLVSMWTGSGKTTVMAEYLRQQANSGFSRALCVAHTYDLVNQIRHRIRNQFEGEADIGVVMGRQSTPDARLVVASRQSLSRQRMAEIAKYGQIDMIVIDEAHHAVSDNTYGDIVSFFRDLNEDVRILGFTATPSRMDQKALASLWDTVAYEYPPNQAIADGVSCDIKRVVFKTQVDLRNVRIGNGDFQSQELIDVLSASNWVSLCAEAYFEHLQKRKTLAFFPGVEMSRDFVQLLQDNGVSAAHLDGETPKNERDRIIDEYKRGDIMILSNCQVLTEGFDAPRTSAILLARPTHSDVLFTQIIGRGVRIAEGKTECLLLDMTVGDRRALQVSDILGDTVVCAVCKKVFMRGRDECPHCGADANNAIEQSERDNPIIRELLNDGVLGEGVIGKDSSVWGDDPLSNRDVVGAWFNAQDLFVSCLVSDDFGTLLIAPPTDWMTQNTRASLVYIPPTDKQSVKTLYRSSDVQDLRNRAEYIVRKYGSRKFWANAEWRQNKPQRFTGLPSRTLSSYLGKGVHVSESAGVNSQVRTHISAVKRYQEWIETNE